jgi:hypothetical protein
MADGGATLEPIAARRSERTNRRASTSRGDITSDIGTRTSVS